MWLWVGLNFLTSNTWTHSFLFIRTYDNCMCLEQSSWGYIYGWDIDSIFKASWFPWGADSLAVEDSWPWRTPGQQGAGLFQQKGVQWNQKPCGTSNYILKAGAVNWLRVVGLGKDRDIKSQTLNADWDQNRPLTHSFPEAGIPLAKHEVRTFCWRPFALLSHPLSALLCCWGLFIFLSFSICCHFALLRPWRRSRSKRCF